MRFAPGRELELEGGRGEASGLAVVSPPPKAGAAAEAASAAAASSARLCRLRRKPCPAAGQAAAARCLLVTAAAGPSVRMGGRLSPEPVFVSEVGKEVGLIRLRCGEATAKGGGERDSRPLAMRAELSLSGSLVRQHRYLCFVPGRWSPSEEEAGPSRSSEAAIELFVFCSFFFFLSGSKRQCGSAPAVGPGCPLGK